MPSDPIQHLRGLLAKAPHLPNCPSRSLDGVITCPMCDGGGDVDVITSDTTTRRETVANINVTGFQCFGIGEDHLILEQLARQAIRALPALLAVVEAARAYMGHKCPNGDLASIVNWQQEMDKRFMALLDAIAKLDEVKQP